MVDWKLNAPYEKISSSLQKKIDVADEQTSLYVDSASAFIREDSSRKQKLKLVQVHPLHILCDCGSALNNHSQTFV